MIRTGVVSFAHACALVAAFAAADKPALPSFGASQARAHEIKPHRHTVSMTGIGHDYSMLDLTLTVSPQGRVLKAVPSGGKEVLACWPQLRSEVMQWRFQPFAADGKAVTAVVKDLEEEIDWLAESRRWIYGPGGNSPRPR